MIRGRVYEGAKESKKYTREYITLDGTNLENEYGLKLTDYDIGAPTVLTNYIDVPGRPGMLDATLALNGKVNYQNRTVSCTFHVSNLRHEEYTELLNTLLTAYQGVEAKMVFSFDPDWYYKGRFEITGTKSNDVAADITFSSSYVFPYKLEKVTEEKAISTSGTVTLTGKAYNGMLTVNASVASMTVTYAGTTYTLAKGDNKLPEIHLKEGSNSLTVKGSGTVKFTYERGVL